MRVLLLSATGPCLAYVLNRFQGVKHPLYVYLGVYVLFVVLGFTLNATVHADESLDKIRREVELDFQAVWDSLPSDEYFEERELLPIYEGELQARLTPNLKQWYWNGYVSCADAGMQELRNAQKISLFIPDINVRTKVETAIKCTITACLVPGLHAKAVVVLGELLVVYCMGVYDQWEKIRPYLNESEIHYKNADYFWKLLHPEAK